MRSYSIDLGFDWNIMPEGATRHLQDALCVQLPFAAIASYFRTIQVGDLVAFNVYDITCNLNDEGLCSDANRKLDGGEVSFKLADSSEEGSPFGPDHVVIEIPPGLNSGPIDSLTFNGRYPHWPMVGPYKVVQEGRFIFRASLKVTDAGDTKPFTVDPEMETGPG